MTNHHTPRRVRRNAPPNTEPFHRYLRRDEEKALFRAIAASADKLAHRDHAWMRLVRHTGIRVGALARLQVGDAMHALEWKELRLSPAIQKGRVAHSIHLNSEAKRALEDLLRIRRQFSRDENPNAPLVLSRTGRVLSIRSFQSRVRYWARQAQLPVDASPHWLRHTLAKRIMAQSTARSPESIVRRVLGHRSLASTAIYTAPDRDDVAQALDEAAA